MCKENQELKEYIVAKRNPISHCVDLTKYFIGRHKTIPVYLTTAFEMEFNFCMRRLEELQEQVKKQKEVIDKAKKILNECKLLMTHEFDWEEQVDNALDILKEVSE